MSTGVSDRSAYLERVRVAVDASAPAHINPTDPPHLRWLKRLIPYGARTPLREAVTTLLLPQARKKAARLSSSQPLLLNLGSGYSRVIEWINIDLFGAPVDLVWNLKRGIPFPDRSASAVYSEHLFEHLPIDAALALISESVRVLRPNGVFRVAVPDAGSLLRSYAGTDGQEWALSQPTRMQAVMMLFYENGHMTMYDDELLTALCELGGLTDVHVCGFRESAIQTGAPDSYERRAGTLYVEGIRPQMPDPSE
jgi:predicted SAM-dependent methyltransferase